jgi:hypothetical protein
MQPMFLEGRTSQGAMFAPPSSILPELPRGVKNEVWTDSHDRKTVMPNGLGWF